MQQLTQLEHERNGLLYTFTLKCNGQDEELTINVVRKEEYAEWESMISRDPSVDIYDIDMVHVKYSPSAKFRIIYDYVLNQLDDMHTVYFPDAVNVDQLTDIMIKASPKYGKCKYILIPISPKKISEVEVLKNNLIFQKESTTKQLNALQYRILELEKRIQQIENVNNKRPSFGLNIW